MRMDLSHSAWSDIFFLGMDFPEGARVLNVSIDLAVRGRDTQPRPPVEAYLHGVSDWQPPETQVAWREEVESRRASSSVSAAKTLKPSIT